MIGYALGYWPTIEYTAKDGYTDKLWTYDSSTSMEKAIDVIRRWAEAGYQITRAYVDVYSGDAKEREEINLAEHGIALRPVVATPAADTDWLDEFFESKED